MNRIRQHRHIEPYHHALRLLPPGITARLACEVLAGADPVAAGLHRHTDASYGRSYRDTAHVAYEYHQGHMPRDRRAVTIVLPDVPSIAVVVHELGHVLHAAIRFQATTPQPVTWYAQDNDHEAFAEAFAAWALPYGHGYGAAKDRLHRHDPATVALFNQLAQ